ncbi:hypothetical protein BDN72DRAFT_524782 [Pluteus cervinus]|uniref:Uncharacterized protein n=1 Tax=Pluteus cervinus TaxID=181527 RepID=A0ACD3A4A7_9AGAR|nr:hypothetical protein BDN72DRAFT_524782 [Pluteus cervinus]
MSALPAYDSVTSARLPGYDSTRIPTRLTDADIARAQAQIGAQLSESESIIQGIESFSGDCFELKNELYQTLQELKQFESRLKPGPNRPKLADAFGDCIKKYESLLSSVQSFAAYAAGHTLDSYTNIVVEAAKDKSVSKEELLGILEEFIHSEPSPDVAKSRVHLDHLLAFLQTFSEVFESTVGKSEPSDVDIRAANNEVIKCRKEVFRLQATVDKLFANTKNDWTVYILYAVNLLLSMIVSLSLSLIRIVSMSSPRIVALS